ncbi:MAG: ATP-grasp domain-containing protein [Myxococcales bacterium]|nr:ATP-grasp domain-containing protein [Myxococcales bacterium]
MPTGVPAMKIAVLHYQPSGEPLDPVVPQLAEALIELGHQAVTIAVHDRVSDILLEIERSGADLVFNACETFADDYRMEVNVAALMEMAQVRHTGSGTAGLLLAQDKILTKQLLGYHQVPTPTFATFDGETFETNGRMSFPLIVKPARSDASLGITRHSLVKDWDELTKRVREIRREFRDEALAEEFIDGREVYVGVLGTTTKPEILPIVELNWGDWDEKRPKISDREVKFGPETPGSPHLVMARDLSDDVKARVERAALLAFRALKQRDYARVDVRIDARTNEPYVLEVNPNPYLEKGCELAMAAKDRGMGYVQLVGRVVESAASRYGMKRAPAEAKPEERPEPAANAN